ncbi:MAG: ABC transporter substrate-binding protein [Chloroflexota bacterium]
MRLRSTLLVGLMAAVLIAGGCVPATPPPAGGGSLTRAMTDEPVAIDPQGAANSGLNLVLPYIFDTLITRQADGKFVGLLAERWQVAADGRSVDVHLRPDVKFHDGSPLNADAVVFTFDRFKVKGDKSPIAGSIKDIASVKAVDNLTVRFNLQQPNSTIISTLAMPHAAILSPAAVNAAGDEMGRKPVGTGPFKFADWQSGVAITLARNPDYKWGTLEVQNRGPVAFEKLVFKVVPDASTQLAALQAGEIDVLFVNEPSQLAKFEQDKALQVQKINLDSLIYLGYNCAKPPFDDVKVRQALSHAVDKNQVIATALAGMGKVARTPLTPSMLGYDESLGSFGQAFDLARAKALLAESGFSQAADGTWQRNGQKLAGRLLTSTRAPNEAIATVLQSQLKALGVPMEIQQLDSSAVMKATTEGSFDLLLWRYEWNDPDALNIYLGTSRIRQTNRAFYSNKEVDALLQRGLIEFDSAKRAAIYQEAQKKILADAPWQPLYLPVEAMVSRNRVQGIKVGALGRMLVNDVTITGQ